MSEPHDAIDKPTVEDSGIFESGTLMKYLKMGAQLSPALVIGIGVEVLRYLKEIDIDKETTFYLICAGCLITCFWMLLDWLSSSYDRKAEATMRDFNNLTDKAAQKQIHIGLQGTKLLDDITGVTDNGERALRRSINEISRQALIPSVYHNHHCRELQKHGVQKYSSLKRQMVLRAFDGNDIVYRRLAEERLPKGMSFEMAVDEFVGCWLQDDVVPAVRDACEHKIEHYNSIESLRHISRGFRKEVQVHRKKNEEYVHLLSDLYIHSVTLRHSGIITPEEQFDNLRDRADHFED